jgi:hypothetical protein
MSVNLGRSSDLILSPGVPAQHQSADYAGLRRSTIFLLYRVRTGGKSFHERPTTKVVSYQKIGRQCGTQNEHQP